MVTCGDVRREDNIFGRGPGQELNTYIRPLSHATVFSLLRPHVHPHLRPHLRPPSSSPSSVLRPQSSVLSSQSSLFSPQSNLKLYDKPLNRKAKQVVSLAHHDGRVANSEALKILEQDSSRLAK